MLRNFERLYTLYLLIVSLVSWNCGIRWGVTVSIGIRTFDTPPRLPHVPQVDRAT